MVPPVSQGANELDPNPRPKFDIETYLALYDRANSSCSAFEHEVIDKALDDLVARPDRRASGQRLAANLRRTARKRLLERRRPLVSSEIVEFTPQRSSATASDDIVSARAAKATGLVACAVNNLPRRARRAFHLSLTRTPKAACHALGIKRRQLRSLLATARSQINHDSGAVAGFQILQEMFVTNRWAPAQAVRSTFGELAVSHG